MRLKGKAALVTGASRGIGRAIAVRYAKEGALVAVHYGRNSGAAAETVRLIAEAGGKAFAIQAELSSVAEIGRLYTNLDAELIARTGQARFEILVNNAGMQERASIEDTTESILDRHFAVNVKGPFFVTKLALPRMNDGGRIINVSSGGTRTAFPEYSAYFMSKAAINYFTLALAQQLGGRGVTVNTLAPGITETDMTTPLLSEDVRRFISGQTALRRIGTAEDLAGVAAFLASDDSRWVTAQYIEASGGFQL
jgi:3-oxoacyl-[acyl-carrier protein] reductase